VFLGGVVLLMIKWNDVTPEIIEKYREREAEIIKKLKRKRAHTPHPKPF